MRARSALLLPLALACACTGGLGEAPSALPSSPGSGTPGSGTTPPATPPPPDGTADDSRDVGPRVSGGCVITGCNDQLCSDHLIETECTRRPQDGCFQHAICERNATNACGWRASDALHACLADAAGMPSGTEGAGMFGTGSGIASDAGVSRPDGGSLGPGGGSPEAGGGTGTCTQGGCFGEQCTEHVVDGADCSWSNEYACYYASTCERQPDGRCGWTPSADMEQCLQVARMLGGGLPIPGL